LDWEKEFMERWIPWAFGVASILFAFVGGMTIRDIVGLIKDKHEKLLKDAVKEIDKETKRSTK